MGRDDNIDEGLPCLRERIFFILFFLKNLKSSGEMYKLLWDVNSKYFLWDFMALEKNLFKPGIFFRAGRNFRVKPAPSKCLVFRLFLSSQNSKAFPAKPLYVFNKLI